MKLHSSITYERVIEAINRRDTQLDNPGFCNSCGADHNDCEPDARGYICDECDAEEVYGAEEYLFMLA